MQIDSTAVASAVNRLRRWSYGAAISDFLRQDAAAVIGSLVAGADFAVELGQRNAWQCQIALLQETLAGYAGRGAMYFEYAIPRLGKRVDTVLILDHVLFVLEFKVGEKEFTSADRDQVWDYALDLKNFHEPSHSLPIVPLLIATESNYVPSAADLARDRDGLLKPIRCGGSGLPKALALALDVCTGPIIAYDNWQQGRYQPTPTIVEAATALYAGHAVEDISRSDAGAKNLALTSTRISQIIEQARQQQQKAICFVTGVPGAGKTLVGLDVATRHINKDSELYSVFLSGNGPLVAVLREALARDKYRRSREQGKPIRLGEARSEVKMFIQNVHHFRDDGLADPDRPPIEHVALFDEAQRAWNWQQTASFMRRKKAVPNFQYSEPEFLISCMDRHPDWAVVVCLVGSGQEINTGEAGISEWLAALRNRFRNWAVYLSPRLHELDYHAADELTALAGRPNVFYDDALHLATSVRSFRSEHVSAFVNQLLDLKIEQAQASLAEVLRRFPIRITRSLANAKQWLRQQARGTERYGIVVSSQAQRLKPYAIDVRVKVDPVHWFLYPKEDVRSSYYLEDVATEFQVQGLELDWACVVWDGDLRLSEQSWQYFSFVGDRWQRVLKEERRRYLLNAYRVLLTRARQGMVIVVPEGDPNDPTRLPVFYDPIYELLLAVGVPTI